MEGRLNLYLVELPENIHLGYGSYSDFVVVAESEEEARRTHPSGNGEHWNIRYLDDWIKSSECNRLVVTQIGVAMPGARQGHVICANFHAG